MEIINIYVSDEIFDSIKNGTMKEYCIDVTHVNFMQLLQLDQEGYEREDEYGNALPIEYEHIRFKSESGKCMIVDIRNAECIVYIDENDKIKTYDYDGEKWFEEFVSYKLGEIREPKFCPEWSPGPTANKPEDIKD